MTRSHNGHRVCKVRRQDQKRLDQRDHEDGDDDDRDDTEELPHDSRHEQHRRECKTAGQNRENHRLSDFFGAADGGLERTLPLASLFVDRLADDDGVVDDHA